MNVKRDKSLIELSAKSQTIGITTRQIIDECGLCQGTVLAVLNGWGRESSRRLVRLAIGQLAHRRAKAARALFNEIYDGEGFE